MARTPIAALQFTINDLEALDNQMRTSEEKFHVIGSLAFELRYRKSESEKIPYFSIYLASASNRTLQGNSGNVEVDIANSWGRYNVDFGFEILKLEGESYKRGPTSENLCEFSKQKDHWGYMAGVPWDTLLDPANKYVVDNELKGVANIYSVSPSNVKSGEQLTLLKDPSCSHVTLLETFLEGGIGADVSFIANDDAGVKSKAHSGILIAASPVFKAMFEAEMEEAKKREIKLEDMTSAHSVRILLKCIYTGSVSYLYGGSLSLLKEVINAAEKYQLGSLKERAAILLLAHCRPKNAVHLVHFAKQYGLQETEKAIREYIKKNIDSVVENTVAVPPVSDSD